MEFLWNCYVWLKGSEGVLDVFGRSGTEEQVFDGRIVGISHDRCLYSSVPYVHRIRSSEPGPMVRLRWATGKQPTRTLRTGLLALLLVLGARTLLGISIGFKAPLIDITCSKASYTGAPFLPRWVVSCPFRWKMKLPA